MRVKTTYEIELTGEQIDALVEAAATVAIETDDESQADLLEETAAMLRARKDGRG